MKTLLIASFVLLAESKTLLDKNSASSFLQATRTKRSLLDRINWNGAFTTIQAWEDFKDGIEEIGLPENEVDKLETCVSQCWWKDQALDFIGKAYEEKRETWEEYKYSVGAPNSNRPLPCPQCCAAVPKSLVSKKSDWQKFPQLADVCTGSGIET